MTDPKVHEALSDLYPDLDKFNGEGTRQNPYVIKDGESTKLEKELVESLMNLSLKSPTFITHINVSLSGPNKVPCLIIEGQLAAIYDPNGIFESLIIPKYLKMTPGEAHELWIKGRIGLKKLDEHNPDNDLPKEA